ncbi:MAG: AAA family ATPase [Leptospiraceae bacterium]|nr:AAA family ATPase [Leptospiraceae bacterium]
MIRGLVLGKFLPPHTGHLHLIREARQKCDLLTVVVGTLKSEPIEGQLRFRWMKELCQGCRVVHLTDENPQYPEEHPEFWNIWKSSLRRMHPEPVDLLFSSELYGDRLASELGAEHRCIDLQRQAVPISGTEIRHRPLRNYRFIPEIVRPYFHKKIVITGAESTGKTTTARHLANRLNTVWAHEYAREYLDCMGRYVEEQDIAKIARGQIALEDRMRNAANRAYICDTDLMATIIYSQHYFGGCPDFVATELQKRVGDFYVFMDVDIPWVDDPQRDAPHLRREFRARFLDILHEHRASYAIAGGAFRHRLQNAYEIVTDYLKQF